MLKVNDNVTLNKDIFRDGALYGKSGEHGQIVEIFKSWAGKIRKPHINAKVKIGGLIKTFKIGSLDAA